jgi:hypothetical protein
MYKKNWRIMDKQSAPKDHRVILHIDLHSFVSIKITGYKIFTGLSYGTVKVLKDPEVQIEGDAPNTASSESVPEGEEDGTPTPSDGRRGAADTRNGTRSIKSISADQETTSEGTWPDRKEKAKVEGMDTDPSPNK